jgi:hypothetical protein
MTEILGGVENCVARGIESVIQAVRKDYKGLPPVIIIRRIAAMMIYNSEENKKKVDSSAKAVTRSRSCV